ncbi:MAG: 4-hydroxybenzoate octaprenyltransferase [Hyphomicrobiales bacterium]|nr:4-hydroxybenzoate octaprenyltransferase [Hyphomicrobiales bacterium]
MQMTGNQASDIAVGDWVDRSVPAAARPYFRLARIDRPIGTWLLLFPCWWSLAMAAPGWPDLWLMALFGVGALVMRGAGCALNDIADRDFDGRVARTATRPIPSGAISVLQALLFMAGLMLAGLVVLLQFNPFAIWLGVASLSVAAVYPFMKRITYWPQVVLGLAFNWGALLGWAAVRGDLDWAPVALYAAGIFWTLGYDTIYAHQDKEDDLAIGVKSTALRLGEATPAWLAVFYALATALMALAGTLAGLDWPFYAVLALAGLHMAWQAVRTDIHDPVDCLAKFKSNRAVGWLVLAAMVAGRVAGG